jgi:hypothetical protein
VGKVGERKCGEREWHVGTRAACMHMGSHFVSGVPGRDSIHRVSTGDAGHKMRRYLALGDATGTRFSPFLVRRPPNAVWGTRLEMLLSRRRRAGRCSESGKQFVRIECLRG